MYSGKHNVLNCVSVKMLAQLAGIFVFLFVVTAAVPAFGQSASLAGDANIDGVVNLDDFIILKQNYGAVGAGWGQGDFNGDGTVNLDDFILLKQNYGLSSPASISLDLGGGVTMQLVKIPAGTFMMGSPIGELDRLSDEGPVHSVTLSQMFYMGIYEVTQAQYQVVTGSNPSYFTSSGLSAPVETVTWDQAAAFCASLSQQMGMTGMVVRLPTEAQWEYACRAGTTTRYYFGDDLDYSIVGNYAWYLTNGNYQTHPVGEKIPNAWGLYDMSGNVYEYCKDWYTGDYYTYSPGVDPQGPDVEGLRVVRGGSYMTYPKICRSAYRNGYAPHRSGRFYGFRVVVVFGE